MKESDTALSTRHASRDGRHVRSSAFRHLAGAIFIGLGVLASAAASAASGHASVAAGAAQPRGGGGVQFYSDEAAFDAAIGIPTNLTLETFDNGAAVGPFPTTCDEPFDSTTNNACFAPGQLAPGFSLTSTSGAGIVVVPPSFFGENQTTRVVGATQFADATITSFSPAASAVAADVFGGINTTTYMVDVEVFDESGASLGSTTVTTGDSRDDWVFLGIVSPTPIGKVVFTGEDDGGELIDNLQFRPAVQVPPGAALSFSPSGVVVDTPSTLTITLGNQSQTGTATLTDDFTDTLPAGLVVAASPNASTDCADGTVTAFSGAGTITLSSGAQIAGGGTCTLSVDVVAAAPGLYTNTIPAGTLHTDLGDNEDAASATLTVISDGTDTFPPTENFDEVFAPAIPSAWTSSTSTGTSDWTTVTDLSDSAPNAAFAPDLGDVSDLTLDSPEFTPVANQTVTFRHAYNLERGFDGAVLEISINGGEFSDILSAGGRFVTGGYGSVDINWATGNPLANRPAWTGDSNGFVTTTAVLPAAAVGQTTRLRFRTGDDASNLISDEPRGWWLDSIELGVGTEPPSASFNPASLSFSVDPGESSTLPLWISNASGSSPLTFSIESHGTANRPKLVPYASYAKGKKTLASDSKPLVALPPATMDRYGDGRSHVATVLPWATDDSILFQLDDGSQETSVGTGTGSYDPPVPFTEQAAVYINRFHADDALTIRSISVYWPEPSLSNGDLHGLQANLVVYYDADSDGDPRNAVRVGTDKLVSIGATGNFETYPTEFSIPAAGDIYIGFVDQWALAGGFTPRLYPAAIDEDSPHSQSYFSSVDVPPVDIVNLANNDYTNFWTDSNLMIRASANTGSGAPCTGPIVDWLSVAPTGTTINGGDSAIVAVTADSSGLASGNYSADVCITTDDPSHPLLEVPVSLTVTGTPPGTPCSASDEIFCDGFDSAAAPGSIVSGTINQAVTETNDGSAFDFATGSYHPYDPSITDDDVNLYDYGDGRLAVYWYGDVAPVQVGGVADGSGNIKQLHSGDTIGPDSTIGGSVLMTNWLSGADGYVGVVFYNEDTGALNYGYLHLTTTAPGGFPAQVLDWAYDNSGAPITIP